MNDREARLKANELLERWLRSDGITNYELEDSWPHSTDKILGAVPAFLFRYFNGHPEEPLKYAALEAEAREAIKRTRLFLKTSLEYEWPVAQLSWMSFGFWESILWNTFKLRSMRASNRRAAEKAAFCANGDFTVWPFISKEDYDAALASKV